jgi:hypothetical protein
VKEEGKREELSTQALISFASTWKGKEIGEPSSERSGGNEFASD